MESGVFFEVFVDGDLVLEAGSEREVFAFEMIAVFCEFSDFYVTDLMGAAFFISVF